MSRLVIAVALANMAKTLREEACAEPAVVVINPAMLDAYGITLEQAQAMAREAIGVPVRLELSRRLEIESIKPVHVDAQHHNEPWRRKNRRNRR